MRHFYIVHNIINIECMSTITMRVDYNNSKSQQFVFFQMHRYRNTWTLKLFLINWRIAKNNSLWGFKSGFPFRNTNKQTPGRTNVTNAHSPVTIEAERTIPIHWMKQFNVSFITTKKMRSQFLVKWIQSLGSKFITQFWISNGVMFEFECLVRVYGTH